jgi:low affinity Fe/Cu permease
MRLLRALVLLYLTASVVAVVLVGTLARSPRAAKFSAAALLVVAAAAVLLFHATLLAQAVFATLHRLGDVSAAPWRDTVLRATRLAHKDFQQRIAHAW